MLLKNISISAKFKLIALGFSLPVAILLYLLISEKNIAIEFAEREIVGVRYMESLSRVFYHSARHSVDSPRNGPFSGQQEITATEIHREIRKLGSLDGRYGEIFKSSLFKVKSDSVFRWLQQSEKDPTAMIKNQGRFFEHLRELIVLTGDLTNLTLDPDLDSFYLMDIVINKMPDQMSLLIDLRHFAEQSLKPDPHAVEMRSQFIHLNRLLQTTQDNIEKNLKTVARYHPATALPDSLQQAGALHERNINALIAAGIVIFSGEINSNAYNLIKSESLNSLQSAFVLWDVANRHLHHLLQNRIDRLTNRKLVALGSVGTILLLTIGLFRGAARSIVKGIGNLDRTAQQVMAGNLDVSVENDSGDEIGRLSTSFNQMIRTLNQLITENRLRLTETQEALDTEMKEHKEAERERTRSDMLFRNLWDISVDGMRLTNQEGKILLVNEAFCHIVEMDKGELIGEPFYVVYHRNQQEEVRKSYEQKFKFNAFTEHYVCERILWNGKRTWLEFSNTILEIADAGPLLTCVIKDITERKNSEIELARSEERYRLLFNNANDVVFVNQFTDDKKPGPFIEVNDVACRRLIYSRDELIGLNPYLTIPNQYTEKLNEAMEELFNKGHVIFELTYLTKDKRKIPFEVNAHLFEFNNKPTILSIARDITERKRSEEILKSSSERLRNLASRLQTIREEERRVIAREIHDELGQVLTVLKIQISLLSNKLRADQSFLKEKAEGLSAVIDEAVDSVQRITAKLRPGILDELGLIPAIEWQAQDFQLKTGITCKCSLPEEEIDLNQEKSTALFRILQEALTNVARHANAKKVSVFLRKLDGILVLEITDNGEGITKPQINDPRSLGILGMKERAMLFGGEVKINGVRGEGSNVRVEMPLNHGG